jgi:hypothetical protein
MIAQYLWIFGSSIFLLLGTAHLRITFLGRKLHPENSAVIEEMKNTNPRITKDTTMWKTWIGFNASHSAGAIFFGALNMTHTSQAENDRNGAPPPNEKRPAQGRPCETGMRRRLRSPGRR